jgi:hypothetical protein
VGGQISNGDVCVRKLGLVIFRHLEVRVGERVVELRIHANLVTVVLEQLFRCVVIFILLHKLLHVRNWLFQLSNPVVQPDLCFSISLPYNSGDFFSNVRNVPFGSGLDMLSRQFGVDLNEADVCFGGQRRAEEVMVVVKEGQCIMQSLYRVLQSFVRQHQKVDFLVFVIDLQDGLESCQELLHF